MQETPNGCVQVRGSLLTEAGNNNDCGLRIEVWPIPRNKDLVKTLFDASRDEINRILTELGIVSGETTDLTAKGPMQ